MGVMKQTVIPGGHPEFLLNAQYWQDGFHFDRFASYVTTDPITGRKMVKAGTPVPSNDANAIGLALSDYIVDDDDYNGAIVIKGLVKESLLPVTLTANAKNALKSSGINFR